MKVFEHRWFLFASFSFCVVKNARRPLPHELANNDLLVTGNVTCYLAFSTLCKSYSQFLKITGKMKMKTFFVMTNKHDFRNGWQLLKIRFKITRFESFSFIAFFIRKISQEVASNLMTCFGKNLQVVAKVWEKTELSRQLSWIFFY